ncbi:glycosyltransferase family 4 protein [Leucobacter sp. M11]|uniref:glycosyltransferase family 4 protein n=1 Tax=Leucobacter sp. M11 TaxID=2993565 RepID=UPI002D80A536|nr:glycosyltransferase family 4 protein [Leucobacter sp. M11]MEB4615416.1 glycosyltransferase family 4 protein [Leucobacter sp. M11]
MPRNRPVSTGHVEQPTEQATVSSTPLARVLVTSRLFAPEPAAASFRLRAVANALDRSGAHVQVLTTKAPAALAGNSDGTRSGVRVSRAPVLRDRDGYVRGYLQYLSFDLLLAFRMLFRKRPALVLTEPPPTTGAVVRVICAIRRVPYAYYAADIWADAVGAVDTPGVVTRLVRWTELFALRGAARVLSVSQGVTQRLAELGISDTVRTIGNGIDIETFSSDGPRESLDGPVLLYAGTASEVHGAGIFLEAFEHVLAVRPEARLVFLGQGSDRPAIEQAAERFPGGTVRFFPRAEADSVAAWLRGAAASLASVRPEQNYDFAFPTKLYASAAVGTPMIFTGVGPGAGFVRESQGGWAVPYTVEAVATAMIAAVDQASADEHSVSRERLSDWARKTIGLDGVADRAVVALREVARHTAPRDSKDPNPAPNNTEGRSR